MPARRVRDWADLSRAGRTPCREGDGLAGAVSLSSGTAVTAAPTPSSGRQQGMFRLAVALEWR